MKKIIKITVISIFSLLLSAAGFLLYFTITEYRPAERELIAEHSNPDTIQVATPLRFLTWNIGYAGLNREMDFFYDGGHGVRPTEQQVRKNMDGIADYLLQNEQTHFILLQEVDIDSKRSYHIDQVAYFGNILLNHQANFAMNYNVQFVPQPLIDPLGKVKSGIAAYTAFTPKSVVRYAFPVNFGWPKRIFLLNRCFMVMRFPTSDHKELVVINTHNSAFDSGGWLRKAELDYFSRFLLDEYEKGNYVIVGGDFNQSPPQFVPQFEGQPFNFSDYHSIPDTLLPSGWRYAFDNSVPSNRSANIPYVKGKTDVTLIDFFILSPNVVVDSVRCDELGFQFSDHNPVRGVFWLDSSFRPKGGIFPN
jgi:endonuclease/exonuclease/phosphatase family metal-dependent hydrolase